MADDITDQPTYYRFVATAAQTVFAVTCRIFDNFLGSFSVKVNGVAKAYNVAGGAGTWLSTQAGAGAEGGTITLATACAGGEVVEIQRILPRVRITQFPTVGPIPLASLNEELSRVVALVQDSFNGIAGTYVPTVTLEASLSSVTITKALYSRVGNIVTVSFMGTYAGAVAAAQSAFTLSLPTPSNLTSVADLGGAASTQEGRAVLVTGNTNTALDNAEFSWTAAFTGGGWISGTFQYEVK